MEGARKKMLNGEHEEHQAHHEPVHQSPMTMKGEGGSEEAGSFDGGEQHEMEQGEKDGHVAFGRHPELDGGHTFKRSLNLGHTTEEAEGPQQWQGQIEHGQRIATKNHEGRDHQEEFVAEMEFHAEEHGEIERHSGQRGIQTHLHVFTHQGMLADHIGHGSQIDTARKLEAEGKQDIKPRPHHFGDEAAEHGHGELRRRTASRSMMIII